MRVTAAIRSRDGMMRYAPMRAVAFVIYRITDIVELLLPPALIVFAAFAALWLNAQEDAGLLR
jgi:hypothetical protein